MSQTASARPVMPRTEPAAAPAMEASGLGREVVVGVDVGGGGEAVDVGGGEAVGVRSGSDGVVLVDERDA